MESTNCKLWPNTLHAAKPWTNERQASKSIMGKLFKCWKRVCFLRPFFLRRNPSLLWASFFSKAPPNAGRHETISMRWSLFPWPTIGRTNGTKSPSDRLQVSTTIWFETKSVFSLFFWVFWRQSSGYCNPRSIKCHAKPWKSVGIGRGEV